MPAKKAVVKNVKKKVVKPALKAVKKGLLLHFFT
jgi:hypothetical protein